MIVQADRAITGGEVATGTVITTGAGGTGLMADREVDTIIREIRDSIIGSFRELLRKTELALIQIV